MPFRAGQHLGDFEVAAPCGDNCFHAKSLASGGHARIRVLANLDRGNGTPAAVNGARQVAHENVADVFEIGSDNSVLYAAGEWVEGETLREKLMKGRLPVQKAAAYAAQIANGLAAAHRVGVIHADLKPDNITITKDGHVKLMDLGLASMTDAEHAGTLVADYAAPEQVRGELETAASDIFSLGVILYEMLSGVRPFLRPTLTATTSAILKTNPPAELPVGVTPALARIVRHCMAKNPAERFASAADVAFALEAFWNLTIPHDKVRKLYKKGFTGVFVACALGGVLGLGAGALIARRYLRPVAALPLSFRHLTGSGRDSSPAGSSDGKTIAYSSDRDGVSRIWTMQLDSGQEKAVTSGPDRYPRFSPDGRTLLFARHEDGADNLYTISAAGGTPREVLGNVQSADWSPDGRIIWLRVTHSGASSTSVLGTVSDSGQDAREIATVEKQVLEFPRSSPDGALVAAVAGANAAVHTSVFVTGASGGGQQYLLAPPGRGGNLSGLTWADDSQTVLYFQSENRVPDAAGIGGGAQLVRQNAKTGGAAVIGFSQQNARAVERLITGKLLADFESRRETLEENGLGREAHEPHRIAAGDISDQDLVYGPAGKSLYFSSLRNGELGIWEASRGTAASRRVTAGGWNDMEPFLFSDGQRVLWTSDKEGHSEIYWAALEDPHPRSITHSGVDAEHASITPDDGWVVYNSNDPAHRGVWKIRQTGLDDTRLCSGETRWPVLSPNGAYVLYTVDRGASKRALQVIALSDGARVGGEIELEVPQGSAGASVGRASWIARGLGIAYIGRDERGRTGVYAQDFSRTSGPSGARRTLGGFEAGRSIRSFAVSPDGAQFTMAEVDTATSIVEIGNLPGMTIRNR